MADHDDYAMWICILIPTGILLITFKLRGSNFFHFILSLAGLETLFPQKFFFVFECGGGAKTLIWRFDCRVNLHDQEDLVWRFRITWQTHSTVRM